MVKTTIDIGSNLETKWVRAIAKNWTHWTDSSAFAKGFDISYSSMID